MFGLEVLTVDQTILIRNMKNYSCIIEVIRGTAKKNVLVQGNTEDKKKDFDGTCQATQYKV